MRRAIGFLKNLAKGLNSVILVETSYLNADMRGFESSQTGESRDQLAADCWKACSKPRTFKRR